MAAKNAPLCPTCLERVLAWTAASCPGCRQSSSVAQCDRCQKSRAGSFVPADGIPELEGGQEPFVCVDCMEETLETAASNRCQETMLVVAAVVFAVFWWRWMPAWGTIALFALALACFARWWLAVRNKAKPASRRAAALRFFAGQIARAKRSRARALR